MIGGEVKHFTDEHNNNNNRVYTPLSKICSQSRVSIHWRIEGEME